MPFPLLSGIDYRVSVVGAEEVNASMYDIVNRCHAAQQAMARPREHGCHYCGNPDPGAKCRYCGVMPRRWEIARMSPGNPARGVKWRYPIVEDVE